MSQNSNTQPLKGILKKSKGENDIILSNPNPIDTAGTSLVPRKRSDAHFHQDHALKFDEKNIKDTFHPEDKDYGHQKIQEALTPFHPFTTTDEESEDEKSEDEAKDNMKRSSFVASTPYSLDHELLSNMLLKEKEKTPSETAAGTATASNPSNGKDSDKAKDFETQRKTHYNEFQAIKQLREQHTKEETKTKEGTNPKPPTLQGMIKQKDNK